MIPPLISFLKCEKSWKSKGDIGAASKVSPNWSQEILHSSNCFSIIWGRARVWNNITIYSKPLDSIQVDRSLNLVSTNQFLDRLDTILLYRDFCTLQAIAIVRIILKRIRDVSTRSSRSPKWRRFGRDHPA